MQLTKIIFAGCASLALTAGAKQPPAAPPATNAPSTNALETARQPRVLTLDECIQLALEHNLDIKIQKITPVYDQVALIDSSYGAFDPTFKFTAIGSYSATPGGTVPNTTITAPANVVSSTSYTPDLSGTLPTGLTYDLSGPLSDRTGTIIPPGVHYTSSPGITLRQPVLRNLWIDNNRYTILLGKNQLKTDELTLRLQIMTVVNNVKAAYYNLIFSRENVKVNATALQLAEQLLSENRKRVEVGALAPLDEMQAQSQAATSRADLITAEQALSTQENVLKSLISDDFIGWGGATPVPAEPLLAIAPDLNLQESWRAGLAQRPEYLSAKVTVERQNINIRYGKNQLFPEVDLLGSYGRSATDPSFDTTLSDLQAGTYPAYYAGISVSIPLGNIAARDTLKGYKEQAKQSLLQLKKQEQTIVIQIDNDVKTIRTDYQRVGATREASRYAQAALEAEQKKLENGKSTSFVVLQLQSNLTTARSAEIRALADYNIALTQLTLDEGTILEKSHIDLKIK